MIKTNSGYARIFSSNSQIWIRFERIGRGSRFNLVLDEFRRAFPLAQWDELSRAWMLPITQLGPVVEFCERILGPGRVQIQAYNITVSNIRQLALF